MSNPGAYSGSTALAVYDGKLIATPFNYYGAGIYSVYAWDGSTWAVAGAYLNYENGGVTSLAVYGNRLVAGGNFVAFKNEEWESIAYTRGVAAWDGSTWGAWSALGTGFKTYANDYVRALCVFNGQLIVGGWFWEAGGVDANYIAAWSGSSWSALGSGMDGEVYALTSYMGRLIAGGVFTTAGGVSASRIELGTVPPGRRWNLGWIILSMPLLSTTGG
jgi:hypothetical protein